jgi:hypothetical protein
MRYGDMEKLLPEEHQRKTKIHIYAYSTRMSLAIF